MNNHAQSDTTCKDGNLRAVIDFAINNAKDLKGYRHLGIRKHVTIQCNSFMEFVSLVIDLVEGIREYYVKETVSFATIVQCIQMSTPLHTHLVSPSIFRTL